MPFFVRVGNRVRKRVMFAIVCIVILIILFIITGLFDVDKTVHANVTGFGAGIYWDQDCKNRTLSLDWGSIQPGSNKTFSVYIQNEGDSAAYLNIATAGWAPAAASSYMTLNWNYTGQILGVSQVIPMQLVLAISPSVTGITRFSFDITITTTN